MCLPLSAITDTAAPLNWSSAAFLYEEPVNNERCCLHWLWSISQYGLSTQCLRAIVRAGSGGQSLCRAGTRKACKETSMGLRSTWWMNVNEPQCLLLLHWEDGCKSDSEAALGSAALHRGFALWTDTHCPHWPQLQSIWRRRSVQNPPVLEAVKIPTWQPSQRSSHSVFNSTGTRKRLHAVPLL